MPELPEVEVVRRGLAPHLAGRTLAAVEVLHPRPVRRHLGGPDDFAARLVGRTLLEPARRGKYLWLPLDSGEAILTHLGMSGQFRVDPPGAADEPHVRVRLGFEDGLSEVRFCDQRMFGGLLVSEADGHVPPEIAHIAPDPFEEAFDPEAVVRAIRRRRTGIKRALLDQTVVSGIGNIYADESLWLARMHYAQATDALSPGRVRELLEAVRRIMARALDQGGTSFDSLYVHVNGESGYFDRSLNAYGREDLPCPRCGTPIRREAFMNRSSFRCPRCQRLPRNRC
ncbi:bifunctional DNA-formamidopyrimidine glycosylase/DNA-(apurinic or apyrimidinic site) lyase [Raineyella fluvialis]|uniref:Formamidopyrimidine-DNA glycosylase n=1 Tax=Raineyella fluvialis TaxID=2662261 RepID=A0A5Q2FD93_9ACTN|nr:bifunctional DNA-formamidopyrimidine glycosylase/DNA-(apurinic or apyrimidinic site) lyase [Raineyella fluvialis]QGF24912.1 bifunctional DNA-formamidopyrimidine glycosylase/DNA-(apurinic or apyrimidinic site) lyase [Raineyella fluvialis]